MFYRHLKRPRNLPPGIIPVPGLMATLWILHSGDEAVILDGGLVGEVRSLHVALLRVGLDWENVRAIVLSHGHLDHTGNLTRLKELTGAPLYGHRLEASHLAGKHPYRGITRLCGWMEAAGRALIRYRPAEIDVYVEEGDLIPHAGGLRVVHLPGHTRGHCGYYSRPRETLFSGDLFADYLAPHISPPFLNSCPEGFPRSFRKVAELNPTHICPNHTLAVDPLRTRSALDKLHRQLFAEQARAMENSRSGNSAS